MSTFKRVRLVVAWLVGAYLARMYLGQGWDKFDPEGFWSVPFERWGYPVWLRWLVGVIEVGGGVALVIPWIASWGGVAVAVVMAGAAVTRGRGGWWVDVAWVTLYGLCCLWIAFEWWPWRRPRVLAAAADPDPAATPPAS